MIDEKVTPVENLLQGEKLQPQEVKDPNGRPDKTRLVHSPQIERPLHILMVTPRFLPFTGGVENHVYQVARRLVQNGLEITVLTTDPSWKLPKTEIIEGIRVVRLRAWPRYSDYYLAPDLPAAIEYGKWDLIHVQSYHTFVPPLAMLAAQRKHIPYLVTFHGGGHSSHLRSSARGIQRAMLKPLLKNASRLVTIASFESQLYGNELGIPANRFSFIPNGCDLPRPPSRNACHLPNLIASIGRLERYKGHQRVISALPYILEDRPYTRLWLAGKGPYEPELRDLAKRLGVQDHVHIRAIPMANRKGMALELSRVSLAILLSEFETHPIAVLEAASLGIPTLVAENSGLSELVNSGLARGIPLDSTDQQVAQAVLQQLKDPLIPQACDLPTWDDCAKGLQDLYLDVLSHRQ